MRKDGKRCQKWHDSETRAAQNFASRMHRGLDDRSTVVRGVVRRRWRRGSERPPVSRGWGPPLAQGLERGRRPPPRQRQRLSLEGPEAGPANHRCGSADAARRPAGPIEGAQGRVLDDGLVVVGQCQFHEAVKVLEDLRVTLDRGLPVFVDASLQHGLGLGKLLRMRRGVKIMVCVGIEALQVLGVGSLAPLREESEVFEDVVLCVSSYPRAKGGG